METVTNQKSYSKHKGALITLIIATVFFLVALIPGIYAAMMSVMLFDAPGSSEKISVVGMFYSIASFPVLCVLSNVSWLFYFLKKYRFAIVVALSPLLSFFAIAVFASFMS